MKKIYFYLLLVALLIFVPFAIMVSLGKMLDIKYGIEHDISSIESNDQMSESKKKMIITKLMKRNGVLVFQTVTFISAAFLSATGAIFLLVYRKKIIATKTLSFTNS